jgi:polysaccharide export outer membrane protein
MMLRNAKRSLLSVLAAVVTTLVTLSAQATPAAPQKIGVPAAVPRPASLGTVAAITVPAEYVIGPNDTLSVLFWRDKDMSADVVVRPDGNITLPLLNDIQAAGLTPDQLRERILGEARRSIEDPSPTVVVKEINSRKMFNTGMVEKPGPY